MKNVFTVNNVKKLITITGLLLMTSTSVFAQSSNSQTSTLLEVQALRQEVAQLRDMVERQQYEMRKMQRQLKSVQAQPTAGAPAQKVITAPQQATPSLNTLNQNAPSQAVLNQGALSQSAQQADVVNTQSVINSASEQAQTEIDKLPQPATVVSSQNDGVSTITTSSSAKVYPPVVEIDLGGAVSASDVTNTSTSTQIDRATDLASTADANTTAVVSDTLSAVSQSTSVAVEQAANQAGGSSLPLLDIKPIETINAQPASSALPGVVTGVANSQNQGQQAQVVAPEKVALSVISEKDYYQQGFDLLKQSKHDEAVTVFKKQIQSYPKGSLADDAYYWVAESMYVNRKLDISKENFKAIIQGYPNSERTSDAMLKLAYIEQEQGNIIEARILLQEIVQFHPNSDAALSAKNRLSELK